MKSIEELKEHIRSSFRTQKLQLPEGKKLFFGASQSFGGYVDIPIAFMDGYEPEDMYQALFYHVGDVVNVSESFERPVLKVFHCSLRFQELLSLVKKIRDEVEDEAR